MEQARLERLMHAMILLADNTRYSVGDLAERLEVSEQTVSRYIKLFKEKGIEIDDNDGIKSIRRMSPFFKLFFDLLCFNDIEAAMLLKGIDSLDETNPVKQTLRNKISRFAEFKLLAQTIEVPQISVNIQALSDAIRQQKQVVLKDYASANSETTRDRLVEPFRFELNFIQLWCYDPEDQKNKLFKIARIGRVEVLDTAWKFEPLHDAGYTDIFRMNSSHTVQYQLKLNVRAANLLLEEYPAAAAYLTKTDNTHWLLDAPICSVYGIGRFVMGLMDDIEVIKPKDFVDFLKRHCKDGYTKMKKWRFGTNNS